MATERSTTDSLISGPATPAPDLRTIRSVAPAWHTAILVVVLLVFSFLSAASQHKFTAAHGPALLYAMTIGWEWLMVGYIVFGIRRRKVKLRELIAGRWASLEDIGMDIFLSVAFWFAAGAVLALIGVAIGLGHGAQLQETRQKLGFLVPRGPLELGLFFALSATAGFCEEVIFRGYFQRQFAALTHSAIAGAVLQAILFGAGHAYEGAKRMFLIVIFGIMFAALALVRNSLRPGMLAHFIHDASAGLVLRRLLR